MSGAQSRSQSALTSPQIAPGPHPECREPDAAEVAIRLQADPHAHARDVVAAAQGQSQGESLHPAAAVMLSACGPPSSQPPISDDAYTISATRPITDVQRGTFAPEGLGVSVERAMEEDGG